MQCANAFLDPTFILAHHQALLAHQVHQAHQAHHHHQVHHQAAVQAHHLHQAVQAGKFRTTSPLSSLLWYHCF